MVIQEQRVWENALHENQTGAEEPTYIDPMGDRGTQITNKSGLNVLGQSFVYIIRVIIMTAF